MGPEFASALLPLVVAAVVPLGLGGKGLTYLRAIARSFTEVI